jgi:hypothetical protein
LLIPLVLFSVVNRSLIIILTLEVITLSLVSAVYLSILDNIVTLEEGSARRRDLYLVTHKTHKRQTPMPPAGFESASPARERPQTLAVDRSATGIGSYEHYG